MTVLCVLGGSDERAKPQIELAMSLSKRLGRPLSGLIAFPDPANAAMYYVSGETVMAGASTMNAVKTAQDQARDALSKVFADATASAGTWLQADTLHETGHVQSTTAAHAILSDATIFPREAANASHVLNATFEYVLMHECLPVILAASTPDLDGPAVIAWDSSPRAMRAVRAHLPLIQSLGHAVIAHNPDKDREIAGTSEITTPEALADWLRDERVEAKVERFSGKVSAGLLEIASTQKAELIVMGAYGHSRIGQMLFGGTSRELLHAERGPALALVH